MAVPISKLTAADIRHFTMDGRVDWSATEPVGDQAVAEIVHRAEKIRWAIEETSRFECGHYGAVDAWVYLAHERYPIRDQVVGIIGSADQGFGPWYEAMVISRGGSPITVEYNRVVYEHPRMVAWTPDEAALRATEGFRFDALLCVSSVEHDGLTRYGDPLNPDGDLEAMRIFRKYLKRDGLLYLTCPVGRDRVCYNWHRIYGELRLPLLMREWLVVDTFGFHETLMDRDVFGGWEPTLDGKPLFRNYPAYEPVFVLRNIAPL
jgi:hypothetical protein